MKKERVCSTCRLIKRSPLQKPCNSCVRDESRPDWKEKK